VYFNKDKKYTRKPKENSYCPEATVGLKQRTVSCPQDRLQTGGPNRRLSLFPDTLQLPLTTLPMTSIYNSSLLLYSTEPTTDYRGRSAYQVNYYYYYYYRSYQGHLRLQSQELREVSFRELLILYKNTSLPQSLIPYIYHSQ
jgi:hypothetical protein